MLRRWQGLLGGSDSEKPKVPRGLYMHGGVGTGKTMLMDLFAESALPEFQASHVLSHSHVVRVKRSAIPVHAIKCNWTGRRRKQMLQ